ncbi:MAG: alkaline phosphatase family protein [Pseudomonadota bacterium]
MDSVSSGLYDRAIFLMLDGARADVFHDLLRSGSLPNISRVVVERGAATTATTVFPSVTGVAYAPYLTGCFPWRTNLPGVKWLDRHLYAHRAMSVSRFRNYTGPGHFMMNRDLSRDVTTLFELLHPSLNILGTISRGTGVRRNAFLLRRVPWALRFLMTGDWAPIDARANKLLVRAAARRHQRFIFHVNLQVDEHSHIDGPFSPRVFQGYRAFDRAVGAMAARLRAAGLFDQTLLTVGSDHGHSSVHEHFDLELFFERRGMKTLYYQNALRRWFDCDVAVMVGGMGMGHVYLRGAGWDVEEAGEERLARLPWVVNDLLAEEAVDVVAWQTVSGAVAVRSKKGSALISLGEQCVGYQVGTADPFGHPPLPATMSYREALELTKDSTYPDGIVQIAQIFACSRAGDVIVSATPGFDLRLHGLRHPYRSAHGSLRREHMLVPLAMSHPFRTNAVRTADVFPTILGLLGERWPGNIDGNYLASAAAEPMAAFPKTTSTRETSPSAV